MMQKMKRMGNRILNPNVIPTKVLMYMAWRNLMHKKLRAFLTIFGVVIGIGAIFFLVSFGLGLQQLVTTQVLGSQSVKSIDITTANSRIIKMDRDNFEKMKHLPHVAQIGGAYTFAASLQAQGSEVDAISYGEDVSYQGMENLTLADGRLLKQGDGVHVLVNRTAMKSVGYDTPKEALGKQVNIRIPIGDNDEKVIAESFTIVGVVDSQGSNEVFLPARVFKEAGVNTYSQVKLEADEASNVTTLRKQIESLGLQTTSPLDTIDQINQVFKFFNVVLAGFGAVGMIVAVLGMFNTLTISLLERTKEIGLMITLGGRNRDMRKLFVFEAALLSVVGAVVGIISAIILGQAINLIMNGFARHRGVTESFQLFSTPLWLAAGMVLFMLAVGMMVVYLPARRAARINPIDALRRE